MSSVDLGAALPNLGGLGSYYARVPIDLDLPTSRDLFRKLPGAGRTVFQAIHVLMRKGREISTTDREFTRLCGIGRRCVQKGLKQLEDLGLISRVRQHGGRIITFMVNFASKAKVTSLPKSGRKSGKPQPSPLPTPARSTSDATAEKSPGPDADLEPTLSPEETAAAIRAIVDGTEASSEPVEASPGPAASSGRHVGPSLAAAVPTISDAEKVRRAEETKRQAQEYFEAKRRSGTYVLGKDQPEPPPAPSGSDEIARE
jgi:hypothetical protein